MNQNKTFHIETNILHGATVEGYEDRYPWLCYEIAEAYGSTLDELLDSGTVSTLDQDGGSGPLIRIIDLPCSLFLNVERAFRFEMANPK